MHKKLRETRLKFNYSSKYMADKLGISKPYYSQLENRRRNLSYDMAVKIAKIFNVKPDVLFYDEYIKSVD